MCQMSSSDMLEMGSNVLEVELWRVGDLLVHMYM